MKDYLSINDYSREEIEGLLELARSLKKEWKTSGNPPLLKDKVLAMVFQKPSLRTRVSFDMAMRHLGGDALYLSPLEIGLGKRESIADVARVLSGYVDILMARVFDHEHIMQLGKFSSIPVINGLSDFNHPCQGLADGLTILEHFGHIKDLNVTFIGDGNNVAVSLLILCSKLGANFTIGNPEGFDIPEDAMTMGQKNAAETQVKIHTTQDPQSAVDGADVIYTDTWTSMGQEEEARQRKKTFEDFQVNRSLLSLAKPTAIVMHCLPAHRGQEITDEVADGPQSVIFPQAHNRLHAQKAVLARLLQAA
jgi:ornithine carbamoyltransferase